MSDPRDRNDAAYVDEATLAEVSARVDPARIDRHFERSPDHLQFTLDLPDETEQSEQVDFFGFIENFEEFGGFGDLGDSPDTERSPKSPR
ncbi:hypothetical protein GCM10009853_072660 [Glycomyces scopariae]